MSATQELARMRQFHVKLSSEGSLQGALPISKGIPLPQTHGQKRLSLSPYPSAHPEDAKVLSRVVCLQGCGDDTNAERSDDLRDK